MPKRLANVDFYTPVQTFGAFIQTSHQESLHGCIMTVQAGHFWALSQHYSTKRDENNLVFFIIISLAAMQNPQRYAKRTKSYLNGLSERKSLI